MFPGQGAQHARMATGLYGHEPVFTTTMDSVLALFDDDLRTPWLAGDPIDDAERAQPLLFAVDYALGTMVLDWPRFTDGVRPWALVGHSVGELVAATLAGVFTVADAAMLIVERARHLADAPPGGMLAVAASADDVRPYLRDDVVVGAENAPNQVLLAGSAAPLAQVQEALRANGIVCMRAKSDRPFHSPAIGTVCQRSLPAFRAVTMKQPRLRLWSAYTTEPLTEPGAPEFWCMQPAAVVRFWPTLDNILSTQDVHLVEAGPGQGLSAIARRHPRGVVTPLLPDRFRGAEADRVAVAAAKARLLCV
jgi:acyl transferase domain-containing protein